VPAARPRAEPQRYRNEEPPPPRRFWDEEDDDRDDRPRRRALDFEDDRDDRPRRRGFRCPYCRSDDPPLVRDQISTAGWVVFAVLLVVFPCICFIGLLMKEDFRVCRDCGARL
jgi:hypothetical protein